MIKAIFFDFDGVLTPHKYGLFSTATFLSEKLGISREKIEECYRSNDNGLGLGKTMHADMLEDFAACLGKSVDMALMQEAFKSTPRNEHMFDLVTLLRRNYQVGIITDNSKERFVALRKEWGLSEKFDALLCSAEIGLTKKSNDIFEKACDAVGAKPEECIFIDNSPGNVEQAKKAGLHAFYFDESSNNIAGLKEQLKSAGCLF